MDNSNDLQDALEKDKQNLICAWEKFTKAILNAAEALNNYFEHANDTAIQDLLKRLERKRGHWIVNDHNATCGNISTAVYYYPTCSVCGHPGNYTRYCPSCGAHMRGDENGE